MKRLLIGLSLILFVFACLDRNSPEDVAEDFVYNYYLRADQETVLLLSASLAEEKLKEEIELLRGIREPGGAPEVHPKIKYEMVGKKVQHKVHLKDGTEIIGVIEGGEKFAPGTQVTIKTRAGETRTIPGEQIDRVAKNVFFRYRLTIKDAESSVPDRNAVIHTELIDGHWKVVHFDEYSD